MKRVQILGILLTVVSLFLLVTSSAVEAQEPEKPGKVAPKAEATAEPRAPGKPTPDAKATPKATPRGQQTPKATKTPGKPPFAQRHGFAGKVTAVAGNILTVESTNRQTVQVTLASDTRCHSPQIREFSCRDIQVGDKVAVALKRGVGDTLVAREVMVVPAKPVQNHAVGKVTAVSQTSITVADKKGNLTFGINAQTKYRFPKGVNGVSVGDFVTVVAKTDPVTRQSIATAIVVHPPEAHAPGPPRGTPTPTVIRTPTATPTP